MKAMDTVFGKGKRQFDKTTVEELKVKLAEYQDPKIYGGTGNCVLVPPLTPEQADECLESTGGFRFILTLTVSTIFIEIFLFFKILVVKSYLTV